jgi:hypothetical protein
LQGKGWLSRVCSLASRVPDVVQDRCASTESVSFPQGSGASRTVFGHRPGQSTINLGPRRQTTRNYRRDPTINSALVDICMLKSYHSGLRPVWSSGIQHTVGWAAWRSARVTNQENTVIGAAVTAATGSSGSRRSSTRMWTSHGIYIRVLSVIGVAAIYPGAVPSYR